MNRVSFSPARVGLIAGNTLLEAARQKLFNFLLLLALAALPAAAQTPNAGQSAEPGDHRHHRPGGRLRHG